MFNESDLIYSYSRAQAIEDGVLVDVSDTAREAGFSIPVALTAAVWADIEDIPESQSHQDVQGRLWDVLYLASVTARANAVLDSTEVLYTLTMHVGDESEYTLKMHIGPSDAGKPVITIMQPTED